MSEMNELINDHVKSEFKRFFEYAFKFNPQYWQEIPGWEVLGKEAARTQKDAATLNRFISSIVTSGQHLKRIINDSSLDLAKELRYYAYLFLKDIHKSRAFTNDEVEYSWFSTEGKVKTTGEEVVWDYTAKVWRLKPITPRQMPEIPEQCTESYNRPNELVSAIKDGNKSSELRQQALNRLKELMPWNKLPDKVFDREIFNSKKWEELKSKLGNKINLDNINRTWLEQADPTKLSWDLIEKYVQAWIWHHKDLADISRHMADDINRFVPKGPYPKKSALASLTHNEAHPYGLSYGRTYWDLAVNMNLQQLRDEVNKGTMLAFNGGFRHESNNAHASLAALLKDALAHKEALEQYNNAINKINKERESKIKSYVSNTNNIISTNWSVFRKEQDEEYPAILAQYEHSLESAKFQEHALTETGDISGDKRYVILRDKLGEAKANELWSSHEKLLEIISGKYSCELKSIFVSRLQDISIITINEQNKIRAGLGEFYEEVIYGECIVIKIPYLDLDNVVDKKEDL